MKRIVIAIVIFYSHLYALDKQSALEIYQKIFTALTSSAYVSIYTDNQEYIDTFLSSPNILLTKRLEGADIILITDKALLKRLSQYSDSHIVDEKSILFTTHYNLLKESKRIVGAFYWRKGRVQLLFIKNRLKHYGIILPKEYEKFTIDTL